MRAMRVALTTGVSIDGGELLECQVHVEREMIDVSTNLAQPDENWSATDSNGHFHAHDQSKDRSRRYPTLTEKSRHVDCDGRCGGDPDECDGWTETWYECAICGEAVAPGTIPGPHYGKMEGRLDWWIDVRLVAPLEPKTKVSVRVVTADGRERFGIAEAVLGRVESRDIGFGVVDEGFSCRLRGIGPLGSRKVS